MDFPADITLRKTRMKFELTFKVVLLFSYQGFAFRSKTLYYFITSFCSCQELFKIFLNFFWNSPLISWCELLYVITWFIICQEEVSFSLKILDTFLSKMCFSCATHIILSQASHYVKHFLIIISADKGDVPKAGRYLIFMTLSLRVECSLTGSHSILVLSVAK